MRATCRGSPTAPCSGQRGTQVWWSPARTQGRRGPEASSWPASAAGREGAAPALNSRPLPPPVPAAAQWAVARGDVPALEAASLRLCGITEGRAGGSRARPEPTAQLPVSLLGVRAPGPARAMAASPQPCQPLSLSADHSDVSSSEDGREDPNVKTKRNRWVSLSSPPPPCLSSAGTVQVWGAARLSLFTAGRRGRGARSPLVTAGCLRPSGRCLGGSSTSGRGQRPPSLARALGWGGGRSGPSRWSPSPVWPAL